MKKLLSLLCIVFALSGCSTTSSWFGGSDCQSKLAREFAENADTTVYFAFDSSALSSEAVVVIGCPAVPKFVRIDDSSAETALPVTRRITQIANRYVSSPKTRNSRTNILQTVVWLGSEAVPT